MSPPLKILLVQLGTPDEPTPEAVKRYLKQFLSDRRVVDLNPVFWWFLLNMVILPKRSPRSAALYKKIWTAEGSPLLVHTRKLAAKLDLRFGDRAEVAFAMRYGSPSIEEVLGELKGRGMERLLFFPLYPQFSDSTTSSSFDALEAALKDHPGLPVQRGEPFYDDPGYIDALAASIPQALLDDPEQVFLVSFHGLPVRHIERGDPYQKHCEATHRLLGEKLGLPPERWRLCYQSRFGKEEWIGPSTQDLFEALPGQGIKKITVICPGFVADCLETLEEIAVDGKEKFLAAGGASYEYVPCVNTDAGWIASLEARIGKEAN